MEGNYGMKKRVEELNILIKISMLFLLFILIPYIMLNSFMFFEIQNYAGEKSGETMEDMMRSVCAQVENSMQMYEKSTMTLYYNGCIDMLEQEKPNREVVQSALESCCYPYKDIVRAYIKSGDVIYHNGTNTYYNIWNVMDNYMDQIINKGGKPVWCVTGELFGRHNEKNYIMARKLNGKNGKDIGILCYIFGERLIKDAMQELRVDSCVKYVIDKDGKELYNSASAGLKKETIDKILQMPSSSGHEIVKIDGKRNVIAYKKMKETGWIFIGRAPLSDMLQSMNVLRNSFVCLAIIYCLFIIVVYYFFQKQILRPISNLKYAMNRFALGDRDIQMVEEKSGALQSLSTQFNSMTKKINELILKNEKEVNEKNNFKYQALYAQLRPHFMYNSLNTIKWLAVMDKQDNIRRITEALIYILMNVAKGTKQNYTIGEEIKLVKQYAVIQKARFMNFEIEFTGEEEYSNCRIFQFLIQTVVENSIIHGFKRGMACKGMIYVDIWKEEDKLLIQIKDNGCGFDVEKWRSSEILSEDHTNIGLKNIEQMIKLEYGETYGMRIESVLEKGTAVLFTLPYREEFYNDKCNNCG